MVIAIIDTSTRLGDEVEGQMEYEGSAVVKSFFKKEMRCSSMVSETVVSPLPRVAIGVLPSRTVAPSAPPALQNVISPILGAILMSRPAVSPCSTANVPTKSLKCSAVAQMVKLVPGSTGMMNRPSRSL